MNKRFRKRLPDPCYFLYLALAVVALAIFVGYSYAEKEISFEVELKKPDMPKLPVLHIAAASDSTVSDSASVADSLVAVSLDDDPQTGRSPFNGHIAGMLPAGSSVDTSSQFFLLLGDSMGEYLRMRLNDYCKQNGHQMQTVIWYSSSTEWYGDCDTIAYFIKKYNPTYILIDLGSNELFVRDIITKRQKYVEHILEQIGDIPYVWIAPPNWKDDTGINELILSNVGASRYFESKRLTYQRCSDGAHPVKSSAYKWMDSVAVFLSTSAAHRVRMDFPEQKLNKVPSTVIISPKK